MHYLSLLLVFCTGLVQTGFSGSIVYPRNAVSSMVKRGENLEIWYKQNGGETIDSVVLVGPFNQVPLAIFNLVSQSIVYDYATDSAYNLKILATVPAVAPVELYDLRIVSSSGVSTSLKAVKVLKLFKKKYTFLHLTDAHAGRKWDGYSMELDYTQKIVKIGNIIGPEFVILTGDNIHEYTYDKNNTGISVPAQDIWDNFYDGGKGRLGMHGFNAPIFVTTGNHDYRRYNVTGSKYMPDQWNRYCGLRYFGFTYGKNRFMAFDNYLANDWPATEQFIAMEKFLQEKGTGNLRIVLQHAPSRVDADFVNKHNIPIVFAGHTHINKVASVPNTQTIWVETSSAGRFYDGVKNYGWFRIVTVEDSQVVSYPNVQYGNTSDQTSFLTLDYTNPNNGTATGNTATITNQFNLSFPEGKIRFVMATGTYQVSNGIVEQVIDNDSVSVVDVRVPIDSNNTVSVAITQTSTTTVSSGAFNKKKRFSIQTHALGNGIKFRIKNAPAGKIKISIFDLRGRRVDDLVGSGSSLVWNPKNQSSGLYLFKTKVGQTIFSNRFVLLH